MQMTTNIFLHLSPQITCATVPPQRAVARRWEVTALQQPVQSELPGQVDAADYQGPGPWQEHWTWLHPHHQRTPAGQGHRHRYTVHRYMSGVVASSYVCLCGTWCGWVCFVFLLSFQTATCFMQQCTACSQTDLHIPPASLSFSRMLVFLKLWQHLLMYLLTLTSHRHS